MREAATTPTTILPTTTCQTKNLTTNKSHGSTTTVRAVHKADDVLAAHGIALWIFGHDRNFWIQARIIAKHHGGRPTKFISHWNPAISSKHKWYFNQRRPAKRWEGDINAYRQPFRVVSNNNDLTNDTTWLTSAQDGSKWESMESDFVSPRPRRRRCRRRMKTTTTTTHFSSSAT